MGRILWNIIRQAWIPTNERALLTSQEALLNRFNTNRMWPRSASIGNGDVINYVDSLDSVSKNKHTYTHTSKITRDLLDRQRNGIPLVMTHGYGSGLGFFFNNYDAMCEAFPRVLSVDWLGMGGSSRPLRCYQPPRVPLLCRSSFSEKESIRFFTDSLERWREYVGIEKFHLLGHSLGGYLAAQYALQYPHRIETLTLASPAGIPKVPETLLDKFVQGEVQNPPRLPWALRLLDAAWASNVTPQQLIRMLGRRGPSLTLEAVIRRFGSTRFTPGDASLLANYLYHITAAPASGEFALNSLLKPFIPAANVQGAGVYAHLPLEDELERLSDIHTHLLFGDSDWLFHPSIVRLAQKHNMNLTVVPHAGHHLYMDNHEFFNQSVVNCIKRRKLEHEPLNVER
eukprot:CFRG6303T1